MTWRYKTNRLPASALTRNEQQIHRDAVGFMLPYAAERSIEAADVIPTHFLHWHVAIDDPESRDCPCAVLEQDPNSECPMCNGIGVLPGYVPYGFKKVVALDPSSSLVQLRNCRYDNSTGHSRFGLEDGAYFGEVIQNHIRLQPNIGLITVYQPLFHARGGTVTFDVLIAGEVEWRPLVAGMKDPAFAEAFHISIRARIEREDLEAPTPLVEGLVLQYQVKTDPSFVFNLPRQVFTSEFEEIGLTPVIESFAAWGPATLNDVDEEDIFQMILNNEVTQHRYKNVSTQPLAPYGVRSGWDLQFKRVYDDQKYSNIQFYGELPILTPGGS